MKKHIRVTGLIVPRSSENTRVHVDANSEPVFATFLVHDCPVPSAGGTIDREDIVRG